MTLIVGIKCSDGIVMGADGAATLVDAQGSPTVTQSARKLNILRSKIIMAVSGQVGLGQLYCESVERLWTEQKFGTNCRLPDALRYLWEAINKDANPAIHRAGLAVPVIGPGRAQQQVLSTSLIAIPIGGQGQSSLELIQCAYDGQPEAATDDIPYVTIGSGQYLADPFLAFLRRIFWSKSKPTVADGIFAVTWTLLHSIAANTGGVAEPIQLASLTRWKRQDISAKLLSTEEIGEYRQAVYIAEDHLRNFEQEYQKDIGSPPDAPKPNA